MMVEETLNSVNKPKNKTARPRPVYLWTVVDVQKWLRRHCSDYYPLYWEKFQQHQCLVMQYHDSMKLEHAQKSISLNAFMPDAVFRWQHQLQSPEF